MELIYYIVANERPYTEILTADYTLISDEMSKLYGMPTEVEEGKWVVGKNTGQNISLKNPKPSKDWNNSIGITMPHVGVLSSTAFLNQYPSTATNRNRARSRWTMYHFLGYDIEASAPRVKIEDASDDNVPTLNNPACVVCHKIMDPIAAGFQDFSDKGIYKNGRKGKHSLSKDYVNSDLYQADQTWYADVLPAGFNGISKPKAEEPLRWLANQIVNDPRFAIAAIKFWWPAVFGHELYESQSEEETSRQQRFVIETAAEFRKNNYNLKVLLADLLMSNWYRANSLDNQSELLTSSALTYNGRRLLTPEEIAAKTNSIFHNSADYLSAHYFAFGGIDSTDVVSRDRNMNVVKANVVKANAYKYSCSIVYQDFKKEKYDRTLFTLVELDTLPDTNKRLIKEQLVVLFHLLLNEQYSRSDDQIKQAYNLFLALYNNAQERGKKSLKYADAQCVGESNKQGFDEHFTFSAWKAMIVALSTDYRFMSE